MGQKKGCGSEFLLFSLIVVLLLSTTNWSWGSVYQWIRNGELPPLKSSLSSNQVNRQLDERGNTPLLIAARNGHPDVVRWLLEQGADPNVRNENGLTPLSAAASTGAPEVAKLLLDVGVDPNEVVRSQNPYLEIAPPLIQAVRMNHPELVRLLLKSDADPNIRDDEGRSPLLHAACKGNERLIHILIRQDASVNGRDNYGWTPLACAVQNGQPETARRLLAAAANPDSRTNQGRTPLHLLGRVRQFHARTTTSDHSETVRRMFLIRTFDHTFMVDVLLRNGASVNARDDDGNTALHFYTRSGDYRTVKRLLHYGANPMIENRSGTTPLDLAIRDSHQSILEEFHRPVFFRAPPDSSARHRELRQATKQGDSTRVKHGLRRGANPNRENLIGWTALHYAVDQSNPKLVHQLMRYGADPCRGNKFGIQPYELIKRSQRGKYWPQRVIREKSDVRLRDFRELQMDRQKECLLREYRKISK